MSCPAAFAPVRVSVLEIAGFMAEVNAEYLAAPHPHPEQAPDLRPIPSSSDEIDQQPADLGRL